MSREGQGTSVLCISEAPLRICLSSPEPILESTKEKQTSPRQSNVKQLSVESTIALFNCHSLKSLTSKEYTIYEERVVVYKLGSGWDLNTRTVVVFLRTFKRDVKI